MHRYSLKVAMLCAALWLPQALAATQAIITIVSPADGATLDAMTQNKMSYDVTHSARGDHVHVYVDGKEAGILRQLKGSYTFETLAPGTREICIKIVNKAHTPIGVEKCIKVQVE